MYCLDALHRFAGMGDDAVFKIASEIAMKGAEGLNYTDPDVRYTLNALPGEEFTGLELMSLMYVAFQRVNPALDLQLPFENAYRKALVMFEDEEGEQE
jgi:hypothetical protein